jgi:hypothetical protein
MDFRDNVQSLVFSNDGKEIICGTTDARVLVWNLETQQTTTVLINISRVRSLKLSPDGKLLAVYSHAGLTLRAAGRATVSLWLFTVCRPWLLALPAESVLRLLLPEEAELDEGPAVVAPDACVGVLRTEEGNTPAFDLGRLLGLPADDPLRHLRKLVRVSRCRPATAG